MYIASLESERSCIYVCCIHIASFYDFSIGFWNFSDSVSVSFYCVLFLYYYIGVSEDCAFTITIKGDESCENLIRENAMRLVPNMVREFGALPTHVTDGSVVIHLKSVDGNIISRLRDSIRRGQFIRLIEELFTCHEANSSIPSGHCSIYISIELDNFSSKKHCKYSLQQK